MIILIEVVWNCGESYYCLWNYGVFSSQMHFLTMSFLTVYVSFLLKQMSHFPAVHVSLIYDCMSQLSKSECINPFPTVQVSITVYKSVCFTYIRVHVSYTQECMSHFSNSACLTYIRVHVSLTQECISHMYNRVNISLILECMSHILYCT